MMNLVPFARGAIMAGSLAAMIGASPLAAVALQSGADWSQIEDTSPGWTWTGMEEYDDAQLSGGTGHAGGPGSSAAYTFHGTSVEVYGMAAEAIQVDSRWHKMGNVTVQLDGKSIGSYSERKPSNTYNFSLVSITNLSDANHVLQLQADSGWVVIDYLSIGSQAAPDLSTTPHAGGKTAPIDNGQHIAVPAYFRPGQLWDELDTANPSVGIAVMNPATGPGTQVDLAYASAVVAAQARGIKVLGYVDTSYGRRDIKQVETDIANYYQWYNVSGIMLDEASTKPGDLDYYAYLSSYIKHGAPGSLVALNQGTASDEGYMNVADVIITFGGAFQDYVSNYAAPAWTTNYPAGRFWNVVYGAQTNDQMRMAVRLSRQRNVGWVYITSEGLPNPWGALPSDQYFNDEISALSGL